MYITILIPVILIVFGFGYMAYMKRKQAEQSEIIGKTDFKAEFSKASDYRSKFLMSELPYLKEAMGNNHIDAYTYGNIEYGVGNAIKDGVKDKLKEVATLGTVKFSTVVTPKYLVLSGDDLHLFDTDTEGDINNHLVFNPGQLEKATLTEYPLQGTVKAQAEARSKNVKAYKLLLPIEEKMIELIIYSCLIFTNMQALPVNPQRTIQTIVIGNDFLKQLGDKYSNLKVSLPIFS